MMTLKYNSTVYKTLSSPVLGTHQPNQTGLFNVIAFESTIRGYVENVFFPLLGKAEAPIQKEIFNKIQHLFYELGAMFSRLQLPQRCTFQKIELVIKMSEQFLDYAGRILEAKSFRFLLV